MNSTKILVIEDDPEWQEKIANSLTSHHFEPTICSNYDDVASILYLNPPGTKPFVAAVLDLKLVKDGIDYEGIYLLEDLIWVYYVPVFVLSGHVSSRFTRPSVKELGVATAKNKSEWDAKEFISLLDEVIKHGPAKIRLVHQRMTTKEFQKQLARLHEGVFHYEEIIKPIESRLQEEIIIRKERIRELREQNRRFGPDIELEVEIAQLEQEITNRQKALHKLTWDLEASEIVEIIENGNVPEAEMRELLDGMLTVLEEVGASVIELQETIQTLEQDVTDTNFDIAHKLKLTVPIVPFVLQYESEMGVDLSTHLNRLWRKLLSWHRYKGEIC